MDISIAIPVYQAEKSIGQVIDSLQNLPYLKSKKWELILVDDFSQDSSFQIISEKAKQYPNVLGISLHKNAGQHAATFVGLKQAKGKYLLTMDDDGEHPIDQIEAMMETIEKTKVDVVYASPKSSSKSRFRKFLSSAMKITTRFFSDGYGDGSAFRLIHQSIYKQIQQHKMPFVFIDEILAWYTKNVYFLPMAFLSSEKVSSYRTRSLFQLYNDIVFTYSSFPAQFLTKVGVSGSIISFLVGVYFIVKKLFFKAQLGFTSIAVSILFSASIILLGLGIIAQYIFSQNRLLNEFPQFSIRYRTDE